MTNNKHQEYQYDSCISRGICSVNPKTSSLQEILILYLKLSAYYLIKIHKHAPIDEKFKNLILNTISVMISGIEISENDFKSLTDIYNTEIPKIIKQYEKICADNGEKPKYLKTVLKCNSKTDIIKSIRLGEKEFNKKTQSISAETHGMLKILFLVAKSLCINVLDLETYGQESDKGFISILEILDIMNTEKADENKLKNAIIEFSKKNYDLMSEIRELQIKKYGEQQGKNVEYSTNSGKALLVVGSNIRELEIILEEFKEHNIDIYTHDEMMLAHTFPKFNDYKNLKGQYGYGVENCLIDFSTFPGPIILTRHSLHNVENLYRGQLYTTDILSKKGIIPIKRGDFSEVIDAAENSRGFKSGKKCLTEKVGFSREETINNIKEKLNTNNYNGIFIIGLLGNSSEQKDYFDNLLKKLPDDILAVSFTCCEINKPNVICLNSGYDSFIISKIVNQTHNITDKKITIFYPECDRHTISTMIYFSQKERISIFVGKCSPIIFNPNMLKILTKMFNINQISSVKKDLSKIIE